MAKLNIDLSGSLGLAPKFYGDMNDAGVGRPQMRYLGKQTYGTNPTGQMAQGYWNPFRNYGYMCPPTSASNSPLQIQSSGLAFNAATLANAIMFDSSGQGTWIGAKNLLYAQNTTAADKFDVETQASLTSTFRIQDLEIYQVNGTKKIFFSYSDTSSAPNIGIINPDGSSINATWLSGTATGGFTPANTNMIMIPCDNTFMYVLNGYEVHKIDGNPSGGSSGTATKDVLVFQPTLILRDGVDFNGLLWIALDSGVSGNNPPGIYYNESIAGVYSWDRQTSTSQIQNFTPVRGVEFIHRIYVTPKGQLRILCHSTDQTTQIREYNGSVFELIQELGPNAYPPFRDSVTFMQGQVTWIAKDGNIYQHGLLPAQVEGTFAQEQVRILGNILNLPASVGNNPGVLQAYGSSTAGLTFSASDGATTNPVYNFMVNGVGTLSSVQQKPDAGNVYTLVQNFPTLAKINYIRLYQAPVGAGGTTTKGTITTYLNQSTVAARTDTITADDIKRGYKYIKLGQALLSGVFSIQFEIAWDISIACSDTADWMPRGVEIDYDPITKLF